MKYIMFAREGGALTHNVPIIFPSALVHADVAQAVIMIPAMAAYKLVSAGEVNLAMKFGNKFMALTCGGESETLKLKSRGEMDAEIIAGNDYGASFT